MSQKRKSSKNITSIFGAVIFLESEIDRYQKMLNQDTSGLDALEILSEIKRRLTYLTNKIKRQE